MEGNEYSFIIDEKIKEKQPLYPITEKRQYILVDTLGALSSDIGEILEESIKGEFERIGEVLNPALSHGGGVVEIDESGSSGLAKKETLLRNGKNQLLILSGSPEPYEREELGKVREKIFSKFGRKIKKYVLVDDVDFVSPEDKETNRDVGIFSTGEVEDRGKSFIIGYATDLPIHIERQHGIDSVQIAVKKPNLNKNPNSLAERLTSRVRKGIESLLAQGDFKVNNRELEMELKSFKKEIRKNVRNNIQKRRPPQPEDIPFYIYK